MKSLIVFSLLLIGKTSLGQSSTTVYKNPSDSSHNFYVIRLPKSSIRGLLVLNARFLSDTSNMKAYNLGICILTVMPTTNYLDNLTSDSVLYSIDEMIGEVIRKYKIPGNKVI